MSALAALGLRLVILDALGTPEAGQYATVAGPHIYDSRLGEIDPTVTGYQPAVVVSVEARKGESLSAINGGAPLQPTATVVFALHVFISATYQVEAEDGGTETVTGPVIAGSDAEAEDLLDTLEAQILLVLDHVPALRRFAPRWLTSLEAEPYRNDEGERYATRALSIGAVLADDAASELARWRDSAGLSPVLAARASASLQRLALTQALIDGNVEALEGVDAVLIKDVPPLGAPAGNKIPFSGL